MNEHSEDHQKRVEEVAQRFRSALHSMPQTRLEMFLGEAVGPERDLLLRTLLRIELASLCQAGQLPSLSEYSSRFAGDQHVVREVFGELSREQASTLALDGQFLTADGAGGNEVPAGLFSQAGDNNVPDGLFSQAGDAEGPSAERGPPPQSFGDYELTDTLGEGGMGVVYRARQRSANRTVALKVIRPERLLGLATGKDRDAINRFRTEAQATAQLEHDNIVTVYEVGKIEGQHFYSMKFVDGRSLAEILVEGPLDNHRAARYMEAIARAVHSAHEHGILHRDLKPQNILVDTATDRPLVADFGLAKLSSESSELTREGEVVGTPQYMAPEQAQSSANVTAQADIYALGATLYHLLTGRPVFQAATLLETLRQVNEEQPAPPRQLNMAIQRDLETICLKCLEKEPARRYESAEALADELRRFLNGEPIKARPISPLARCWRWCRRNPLVATPVGVATALLFVLLITLAVSNAKVVASQRRSERSFRDALTAVNESFTAISESELLKQPGTEQLRGQLLQRSLKYYQAFLERRGDDPSLVDEIAATHLRIGLIVAETGSPEKALRSFDRSLQLQESLERQEADSLEGLSRLGDTLNAKATALFKLARIDEAGNTFDAARRIRQQIVDRDPESVEPQRKLANTLMNRGIVAATSQETDEAIDFYLAAQELRNKALEKDSDNVAVRRDLGKGYLNLGSLQDTAGNATEAEDYFKSSVDFLRALIDAGVANQEDRYLLSTGCMGLGSLFDGARAFDYYVYAASQTYLLTRTSPSVVKYRILDAELMMNLGQLELDDALARPRMSPERSAKLDNAIQQLSGSLQTLDQLLDKDPLRQRYRSDLGTTLLTLGEAKRNRGLSGADGDLKRALETFRELAREFPDEPRYREDAVRAQQLLQGMD